MAEPKSKIGFSTLRGGQIVWVFPEDSKPEANPGKRSRLETDKEVKDRIKRCWPEMFYKMIGSEKAHQLDQILKHLGSERLSVDA